METYLELDDIQGYEEISLDTVYDIEVEDNHNYFLDCGKPILVHNSGKTWQIFLFFLIKALNGENITITIVRDKLSWIRGTLLKDFEEITNTYKIPVYPEINPNRQDQVYTVGNTEFAFFGLDYPAKLHGRKQDYVWINEVMEVARKAFDQLEMRTTRKILIDFNPYDDLHWIYDLNKRDDVKFLKSTMLDNPFLSQNIIDKIKSYEPTPENERLGTADNYMWQVYGLGNKAKLQGVVYNWSNIEAVPEDAKLLARGLDFGFSNSPTALVDVYTYNKEVIIDELIYQTGLLDSELVALMQGLDKNVEIYADPADAKAIEEIRRAGFNIKKANKSNDSIRFGISILRDYVVRVTARSINTDSEARKYRWKEGKDGKSTNEPIDDFNHCFAGSTLITTESGDVPIQDINIGDKVLTRKGFRKVLKVFDNGIKDICEYRIASNNVKIKLKCTPEHKILINNRWTPISELKENDSIYLLSNLKVSGITGIGENGIIQEERNDYTESFTNTTKEIFLKVLRYITKMVIQKTTKLRISKLLKQANTENYTEKIYRKNAEKRYGKTLKGMLDQRLLSGIKAKKEKNGTENTVLRLGKTENQENYNANIVEKTTSQDTLESQSIVTRIVKQRLEERERVYDLMVEDCHEYYANGVLVHNCLDAIRYVALHKLTRNSEIQFFN